MQLSTTKPGQGTTDASWHAWAETEFASLRLGDARLDARLIHIAGSFMGNPQASIPLAAGQWPAAKGTYRFFDNDRVDQRLIYEAHRETTVRRASTEKVVLAIADTTMLDYTPHPETSGLGPLSDMHHDGFLLHPTLAVTPTRVPLGLVDVQMWVRDYKTFGKSKDPGRKKLPTGEKESCKWLHSLDAGNRLQIDLAETDAMVVSVFDREGDVYDVLAKATDSATTCELLVRASADRRVNHPQSWLWSTLEKEPPAGTISMELPHQRGRKARQANLTVRFMTVEIRPPTDRLVSEGLKSVEINVVYATEEDSPEDADALSWMLLTTVSVTSFEDALRVLDWYACRWTVEVFFRVLKSGCKAEDRQLQTADRLKRCLAVDMVVAWRVLYLTTVGRETPDLPCDVIFADYEWRSLYKFLSSSKVKVTVKSKVKLKLTMPKRPPKLGEVIMLIGRLGGHLGRKSDGWPGAMTMWRGLQRLADVSKMWLLMTDED